MNATAFFCIWRFIKLAGLILIGGGSFIKANVVALDEDFIWNNSTSAIVIGCIITIVSFLGCYGAANEKGMLLKTYFGILIILVILEISVGIAAKVKEDEVSFFFF